MRKTSGGSSSSMNPWRPTFYSHPPYSSLEHHSALARSTSGRARPHHLPRLVRPVQCLCIEGQDCISGRHRHQQTAVRAASALLRRHRPGADPGRTHRHNSRCDSRYLVMAGKMQVDWHWQQVCAERTVSRSKLVKPQNVQVTAVTTGLVGDIRVLTGLPFRQLLEQKLHEAVALSKARLENQLGPTTTEVK